MSYTKGGEITSIEALCNRIGSKKHWPFGRAWHGDISDVRLKKRPITLVRNLGYDVPDDYTLHAITREGAGRNLAYLCREGLAYGSWTYAKSEAVALEKMLLKELGPNAAFWSTVTGEHLVEHGNNGPTSYESGVHLSSSTFEFGVVGHNQTRGFAFWVEDED